MKKNHKKNQKNLPLKGEEQEKKKYIKKKKLFQNQKDYNSNKIKEGIYEEIIKIYYDKNEDESKKKKENENIKNPMENE
jgi:hypothetical protein